MGLVLSRRKGQGVLVGNDISVYVDEIVSSKRVLLRFEAPRDVFIVRYEIAKPKKSGKANEQETP